MLRDDWGIREADDAGGGRGQGRAPGLAEVGIDAEEPLPYLLHLLGVEAGDRAAGGAEPPGPPGPHLRRPAPDPPQRRPAAALVLLEIEDLHWVDETSEDFLASLVEGLAAAPLLLLLTYRSGYQPRWMDKSYATQITLRRLTAQREPGGGRRRAAPGRAAGGAGAAVLEQGRGQPLLPGGADPLAARARLGADLSVPDTIQGVLMARIDRLPEDHKRLLQTASVLGREFPLDLLRAIWERPEPARAPLLADLKRWEFLYEVPAPAEPRLLLQARPHPGGGLPEPADRAGARPCTPPPAGRSRRSTPPASRTPTTRSPTTSRTPTIRRRRSAT